MKDNIFSIKQENVGDFRFDEQVVSVFPDMIERSVPGYANLVAMIGTISAKYAKPETNIYDLGCSLGATSFSIAENNPEFNGDIVAVDSSEPMICELRRILKERSPSVKITPLLSTAQDCEIRNASFVAMNLTLQFIPHSERDDVVKSIFDGINNGGAFVLSEKIIFDSAEEETTMHELLFNYKRCRGYSDTEIQQKKEALRNILIPETLATHIGRLKKAGFSEVYQWYQNLNFISILAIK